MTRSRTDSIGLGSLNPCGFRRSRMVKWYKALSAFTEVIWTGLQSWRLLVGHRRSVVAACLTGASPRVYWARLLTNIRGLDRERRREHRGIGRRPVGRIAVAASGAGVPSEASCVDSVSERHRWTAEVGDCIPCSRIRARSRPLARSKGSD